MTFGKKYHINLKSSKSHKFLRTYFTIYPTRKLSYVQTYEGSPNPTSLSLSYSSPLCLAPGTILTGVTLAASSLLNPWRHWSSSKDDSTSIQKCLPFRRFPLFIILKTHQSFIAPVKQKTFVNHPCQSLICSFLSIVKKKKSWFKPNPVKLLFKQSYWDLPQFSTENLM